MDGFSDGREGVFVGVLAKWIVLAVVTDEFLDFSASRGNNLRDIGLTGGCKWCLCTSRWKEAMDAAKGLDDPVVPKYVIYSCPSFCLLLSGPGTVLLGARADG